MFDDLGRQFSDITNFSIGGIVFELKRKKFQRQFVKLVVTHWPRRSEAKAGGETGKFVIHAVFVCRLVFRDSRGAL